MPDVEQHGYRAYPLADHIADKVAATFDRYGETEAPSTRYKDLVDLVAIVTEASVKAQPQMAALASEAKRRRITLPPRFRPRSMGAGLRGGGWPVASAGGSHTRWALAAVRPFLDPLLDGTVVGRWDPKQGRWIS